MHNNAIKSLCMAAVFFVSFNGLRGQEDYYTAAVFEIFQFQDTSYPESEIIKKNLEKYAVAAKVAASHNAHIMVYPEKGLFPHLNGNKTWNIGFAENVPDPKKDKANPCDEQDKFQNSLILRNLSCLAKEHAFYIVADIIDEKKCEVKSKCNENDGDNCRTSENDCPADDMFYYNTIIVFDSDGLLVARYYKHHLFFEVGLSNPKYPSVLLFETDFGKFSGAICFDAIFKDVVENADRSDVTGFVYPTWWYDYTPMTYFSTPFQQAWSMTNKVNILAADVQLPREGSGGSGIYSAVKGALVYSDNPDGRSKLLISNVPKSVTKIPEDISFDTKFYYIDDGNVTELQGEEPRDFNSECVDSVLGNASSLTDYRCHQIPIDQYTFIKLNETKGKIKMCSNKFCCRLNYEAQSMDETFYFAVSGNPQLLFDTYSLGVQSCFLARCEPVDGKPCRNFLLKSNTIFEKVELNGSFKTRHVYPYVINSEIRLTDKDEWNFDGKSRMKYQNLRNQSLLYIELNGRLYNKDKLVTNGGIATSHLNLSVFLLTMLFLISVKIQEKLW